METPNQFELTIISHDPRRAEANARLWDAAPDLLASLKDAKAYINHTSTFVDSETAIDGCHLQGKICAAIAKAEN